MRILVTGANGMLGIDLCNELIQAGHTVIRTDVSVRPGFDVPTWQSLDITDALAVQTAVEVSKADAVIHPAAFTNVDGCEKDPDTAFRINALGTWCVAAACARLEIPITYVSTDFVFDGTKTSPYTEFDAVNPINHYGASKLAGERIVEKLCHRHFIVRTQWLNGAHGRSFAAIMLDMAKTRTEWQVVGDQIGSPTFTLDLARSITSLQQSSLFGTYHVANRGECSWHTFARTILDMAGCKGITLHPIPASQWPSPTRRPAYSTLRRYSLELQGRDDLRTWQDALDEFLQHRSAITGTN